MADLKEIGKQAKAARYILAGLDTNTKNKRQNVWKRTQQTFLQKMQRIWKPDAAAACRKGCLTGSP